MKGNKSRLNEFIGKKLKKTLIQIRITKGRFIGGGIQSLIMFVLTSLTVFMIIAMSFLLYYRYKLASEQTAISNTQETIESIADRINSDLLDIRNISNAANYNIIQEYDISSQEFSRQISLLYEINTEDIQNIALYRIDGDLITSEPFAKEKEKINVTDQEWFINASNDIENLHFSMPHIQELFIDGSYKYNKVISLSRSVDINDGDKPGSGVLLIDMKYSVIKDVLDRLNQDSNGIYYYICSRDGEMIYHPRYTEIKRGLFEERSIAAAGYVDGTYKIINDGYSENVAVGSIAYTGWKLIGVIPKNAQVSSLSSFRLYILVTLLILIMLLLVVNRIISSRISKPIQKLNESVKTYEAGGEKNIYIGGSSEIRHLGYSVQKSYMEIEKLMKEIIKQQNERRKSELAALQSQINPHFLYNTLESIMWMVETHKNDDAVFMISELAKLLRISLSKGHTIISFTDEFQHSKSYLNIQRARYKERFKTEFVIEEGIEKYCVVKLIIQPLLENAIYYGVGNMDPDDEGKITIRGEMLDNDIYITIEDNGFGMNERTLEGILTNNEKTSKHGSGVGIVNVHNRIRLMFGEKYGLSVYSEIDEGTKVVICIPAIRYTKENCEKLERQSYEQWRAVNEKK